jgi:regulatory protein
MTRPPLQKSTKSSRSKNSDPSSPEHARLYALRLLADRDYTLAGLKRKLRAREYQESAVEQAVSGLEQEGWVSDRRFAQRFAESALASGRYVGVRLRLEMLRRGVPEELVDEQLNRLALESDEDEQASQLLARHFPGFSFGEADDREKRRVAGFLQRRGLRFSAVMRAMRSA